MAVRIFTDSACDLEFSELEALQVELLRIPVFFDEERYIEGENLTREEFYEKLAVSERLPKTAQITPVEFEEAFRPYVEAGEEIVVLPLAKELSGYDEIYIVDSQQALCGLRMLVDFACVLRDEGLSAREIAEQVESASHRVRLFGIVNTLEYLHKGGRLPASMAVVGTLLKVKPLITLREGEVGILGKGLGVKNGLDNLLKLMGDEIHPEPRLPLYFGYTQTHNLCDQLRERVVEKYHPARVEQNSVGAVVGTHVGPDGAVVVYLDQE